MQSINRYEIGGKCSHANDKNHRRANQQRQQTPFPPHSCMNLNNDYLCLFPGSWYQAAHSYWGVVRADALETPEKKMLVA